MNWRKYYLNYLEGARYYLENNDSYYNYLMLLRKFINTAWKNRTSHTVRAKYGWLRSKFNTLIINISNDENIDFRIKEIN